MSLSPLSDMKADHRHPDKFILSLIFLQNVPSVSAWLHAGSSLTLEILRATNTKIFIFLLDEAGRDPGPSQHLRLCHRQGGVPGHQGW